MKNEPLKQMFIRNYIKENYPNSVSMLDELFVQKYIDKFNPPYKVTLWGANKCTELSRLLSKLYNCNILDRCKISITKDIAGFPNWIYTYSLKETE